MCYSALVRMQLKSLATEFHARIDEGLFRDLFERRAEGEKLKLPRGLEFNFPAGHAGAIAASIARYRERTGAELEAEQFAQKKRLADAERKLQARPTKTAGKERDIAGRRIEALRGRVQALRASEERPEDSRIFPLDFAPVIVWDHGGRVIRPMRYLCRPAGCPETFDRDYPGCYNARRDSLNGFWKRLYRRRHGALVLSSFFENVRDLQGKHAVLQFTPRGRDRMVAACLWDHWEQEGIAPLDSFAVITDDPPEEIRRAGHDRCPIFIPESELDRWLQPSTLSEDATGAILDHPDRPFYESRKLA